MSRSGPNRHDESLNGATTDLVAVLCPLTIFKEKGACTHPLTACTLCIKDTSILQTHQGGPPNISEIKSALVGYVVSMCVVHTYP